MNQDVSLPYVPVKCVPSVLMPYLSRLSSLSALARYPPRVSVGLSWRASNPTHVVAHGICGVPVQPGDLGERLEAGQAFDDLYRARQRVR